jgi:hypothetical protein
MDQMKKAFKSLFKKKTKKEEPTLTATSDTPAVAQSKPSETSPAAPAPAMAPEPKTDILPATHAPAPAQGEANKDEIAALAEVKQATQSRSTSCSTSHLQL